tara:strand:+ start:15036 stop:15431 length:396 start_codon:yes stop_codon:yes gene_type:complete
MSFDRVDLWLTDKVSPIKEKTKAGKDVWKFFGSMQAYAYDYWAGTPKEQRSGAAPERYERVTLYVMDENTASHVQKIYDKVVNAEVNDPRQHIHIIGALSEQTSKDGNKKGYILLVNEASPLIWGPLRARS